MANTKAVGVKITPEEADLLDDIADYESCHRTDVLRTAIRQYLETYFESQNFP